jgi:hypothetical protein
LPVISESMLNICLNLAKHKQADRYYLAGGTALAIQIKHRRSEDLDFFTSGKVNSDSIISWMEDTFPLKNAAVIFKKLDQLDLRIDGVKVSFIEYPFPLVYPLVDLDVFEPGFSGIKLASTSEIALFKAYALGRRASFRDYIDLYYIMHNNYSSLEKIIADCCKKYVLEGELLFSDKLFLQQLAYTEDLPDKEEAMSMFFDQNVTADVVEKELAKQIKIFLSIIGNSKVEAGEDN